MGFPRSPCRRPMRCPDRPPCRRAPRPALAPGPSRLRRSRARRRSRPARDPAHGAQRAGRRVCLPALPSCLGSRGPPRSAAQKRRAPPGVIRRKLDPRRLISRLDGRVRCDLQQLTFSQRRPNTTATPRPGFGELPQCLACVLMALSAGSERLVRLIELRAQLRDGSAQDFELGALLIAQFDAPIPRLIGLSHRPVFGVPRRVPARRAPGWAMPSRIRRSLAMV